MEALLLVVQQRRHTLFLISAYPVASQLPFCMAMYSLAIPWNPGVGSSNRPRTLSISRERRIGRALAECGALVVVLPLDFLTHGEPIPRGALYRFPKCPASAKYLVYGPVAAPHYDRVVVI